VVSTVNGAVSKYITQERWDKAKNRLKWLGHYVGANVKESEVDFAMEEELKVGKPPSGYIGHKVAEKYRFFVYLSRTYGAMVPYLKGLHLSLDSWRPDRDEDGWRTSNTMDPKLELEYVCAKPPKFSWMVPRFRQDMEALLEFFEPETPPRIPVWQTESAAIYMVGDASGTGFGSTKWRHGDEKFRATHRAWDTEQVVQLPGGVQLGPWNRKDGRRRGAEGGHGVLHFHGQLHFRESVRQWNFQVKSASWTSAATQEAPDAGNAFHQLRLDLRKEDDRAGHGQLVQRRPDE
jgi:hypothetical protein